MVQDVRALQYLNPSQDGMCILYISWRPLIQTAGIRYILNVNFTARSLNTTLALFSVFCGAHSIQIQAENRCGHSGPKTLKFVVDSISQMENLVDKQLILQTMSTQPSGSFTLKFTPMIVLLTVILNIFVG